MEGLTINITNFEGPFDLLLHLIKINKMQIQEIRISEITRHYLDYLESMKEMDLDIASEFLVMAATLLEIKSREMLPKHVEVEDPEELREKLVLRIEEYDAFRSIAEALGEKYDADRFSMTKHAETIVMDEVPLSTLLEGITLEALFITYASLMNRQKDKVNRSVSRNRVLEREQYKVEDKIDELQRLLLSNRVLNFTAILSRANSKAEGIVLFIALLELTRNSQVRVSQQDIFSEIIIERGGDNGRE